MGDLISHAGLRRPFNKLRNVCLNVASILAHGTFQVSLDLSFRWLRFQTGQHSYHCFHGIRLPDKSFAVNPRNPLQFLVE